MNEDKYVHTHTRIMNVYDVFVYIYMYVFIYTIQIYYIYREREKAHHVVYAALRHLFKGIREQTRGSYILRRRRRCIVESFVCFRAYVYI